jgi:hypothetical protein
MRSEEIRATGELMGEAIGGTGAFVRHMHEAIAGRPFRALGPLALPVRAVHDRVSGAVYGAVRGALSAPPRAAGALLARTAAPGAPALAQSLGGSMALGALNGAIGDLLTRRDSELALRMALRGPAGDLPTDAAGLARAFPEATPRLAVFVHGLCETDEAWRMLPLGGERASRPSYGDRLHDDLGYTALYLRYNTGLHVSDNGRRLSELLEQVVDAWPVRVEEIALFGHSMGGLVARSACHCGAEGDHRWAESLRHVFCLGSPHLGAPLEKAANASAWLLGRLPETRALARVVNGRSAGIKDLRFGSCVEEDWCDCDIDEFLRDRCSEVPFSERATHYFVGATLSRRADGALGLLLGDLLVRMPSASGAGRRRRIPFAPDNGAHLGGLTHFDLLNHPAVYERIRTWLERGAPVPV